MTFDEAWLKQYQSRMAGLKPKTTTTAQVGVEVAPKQSRHKAGVRTDIGPQSLRSSWEANFCRYLNWRITIGEIVSWTYEPHTFWFLKIKRGVRSYVPDFYVVPVGGEPYYIELKGYLDAKSKTKLKRMRIYHPAVKVVLVDAAEYRAIAKTMRLLIPTWE